LERRQQAQQAAPTPTADDARPTGEVVHARLSASQDARPRDVRARVGDTVRLTVAGDVVDSVELGELDVEAIDPESPALFELLAEVPGSYPITLLDADRQLGELVIRE
jgi:hypothetical protein